VLRGDLPPISAEDAKALMKTAVELVTVEARLSRQAGSARSHLARPPAILLGFRVNAFLVSPIAHPAAFAVHIERA
jgi:hypothetical protein